MSEQFYERRTADGFGSLTVDVPHLYESAPITAKEPGAPRLSAGPAGLYRRRALPLRHRVALAVRLRRAGVDLGWFDAFASYWTDILGGRPLWGVEDFYFLRGWYRVPHQASVVPDTEDAGVHLEAWQRPELIYQLFHQVYAESRYMNATLLDLLRRRRVRTLLEFGCATAPVTTHALTFLDPEIEATIADIQTIAFHFGAYKLRGYANVKPHQLAAERSFALDLDGTFDAICCITVFEHLNKPLETVHAFHRLLEPGGLLLFDYLATKGGGLDTHQGVEQRGPVLDFIEENFDIVYGEIRREGSTALAAARKRS